MGNLQLSWSIEGTTELSRVLIGVSDNLKDFTQPFNDSADYLKRTFSTDVFQTQGRAIGERWKRLSPATVAAKARKGQYGGPLVATGLMQQSFHSVVSSDRAVIFNTAPYFKFHQSKDARTRLPRRVMMALADPQKEAIVRFFQAYLRESMCR